MRILRKLIETWRKKSTKSKIGVVFFSALAIQFFVSAVVLVVTEESASVATVEATKPATLNEFESLLKQGRIKEATVSQETVKAVDSDGKDIVLNHEGFLFSTAFLGKLTEAGVDVKFPSHAVPKQGALATFLKVAGVLIGPLLTILLFGAIGFLMWMQMRQLISPGWPKLSKNVTVRFADVAGQDEPKFELEEIKTFLKSPENYVRLGAKPPRGVLLVGPPGTGKTLLAKALAGEAGASFMAVTGSDFSAMFVGVGRNRVEKLFKEARKRAPCIIFIDEIDSLARKRGGSGTDVGREQDTTLNQLLTEMDGFKTEVGVIVVAATNRIDVLDPAVLRPGRFDRHVQVGLPTINDRRAILDVHVAKRPLDPAVDLDHVARGTPGFSGADIENIVNEASILAARKGAPTICASDFEEARDKVIMGLQRRSMALAPEERRLIAVHEAGHALVACKLPGSDPVHQATIIPRGRALGLVMRLPEKDRVIVRRSKLDADLVVLMAGRAAEALLLGDESVSNGAASDIFEATKLARSMVSEWGFSPKIGMVNATREGGSGTDPLVEEEIRRFIAEAHAEAAGILEQNRVALERLADALLERETLDGEDVRRVVEAA